MKIRTIFQPDEEVEVHEADAEVARLQGLLHICDAGCPHLKGEPGAKPTDLPQGAPVVKAPAKPIPAAADSAPTDQAPPAQKG